MNETSYEAIKTAQREHFDGVSDKYSEVVGEAAYYHYLQMTKDALFAELSSYFEDLSTLVGIDVGCGQGNLVAAVGARCRAMHGFDISPGMIEAARRAHAGKSNLRFDASPSETLTVADCSVDFTMSVYLLHHLAKEQLAHDTFKEMKRVTRDDGLIVLVDVNTLNPLSSLRQHIAVNSGVDTGLEKLIAARRVISMLEDLEIEILSYRGIGFVPHIVPWLTPYNDLLGKILPHKIIGKDYIIVGKIRR